MERTIICATIDLLEEHLQSIDETALNTDDTLLLKTTIQYWKDEANRAEAQVSLPSKNKCCDLCKHCKLDNDITSASRGSHLCFNSKSDCYYLDELRNIKSFYCSEFARSN